MVNSELRQEKYKMSLEYLFEPKRQHSKNDGDMLKEHIRQLKGILSEH